MPEVAYRHKQLYEAILSNNNEYALYQLEKIILTMRHGAERRPKRKQSYDWFLQSAYPPMKKALDSKSDPLSAYKNFTVACVSCHALEKVSYMPIPFYWEDKEAKNAQPIE